VEFDPFGCSMKDLPTRSEIIRRNNTGSLYPLQLLAWHSLLPPPQRCGINASDTWATRPSPSSSTPTRSHVLLAPPMVYVMLVNLVAMFVYHFLLLLLKPVIFFS
jgi:hypothetical protein